MPAQDVSGQVGTERDRELSDILHVNADGSYTYTLTTPFDTAPDADNGANTETGKDVFTFTVTDIARQHLDLRRSRSTSSTTSRRRMSTRMRRSPAQTILGNVESNDTAGADGIASIAWTGANGTTVTGAHGVLTFGANGSYSYHAFTNASGTEVFNYTITDGTVTLAVDVDDHGDERPAVGDGGDRDGERGGAGYVGAGRLGGQSGDGLDPVLDGGDDDGNADVL